MTDHIDVTYSVELTGDPDIRAQDSMPDDLLEMGEIIAQEQSVGGYDKPFHRDFDVEPYRARATPNPSMGSVTVQFPTDNIAPEPAHLLNYVAGDVFGSKYVEHIRVTDISFPKSFVDRFPGPQFGQAGIRDRVDREGPLLGMILKPSLGLTPERIGELVRAAAQPGAYLDDEPDDLGGVDIVKEDEKLADPDYCSFEDRLDEVVAALRDVDDPPLYVLNVTAREDTFREYVAAHDLDDVLDRFVLLVTVVSHGFGRMQALAEDDALDLPTYAHRAGHAALTRTAHGIEMRVLEQLSRLAGADFAHCGATAGNHRRDRAEVVTNRRVLDTTTPPWDDLEPCLPVVSGGVDPTNVKRNMEAVGERDHRENLVFMIGSGIYAHSGGTLPGIAAGVRANREAIDAAREGIGHGDIETKVHHDYHHMEAWLEADREG